MALIDQIEMLGSAVDSGLIGKDEAVQLLMEYSDGGVTRLGALDCLARHQGMREQVERTAQESARMIEILKKELGK